MFHFFQTIFSGVTSLIASAIIAVGLVSVPTPKPIVQLSQQPQQFQNEEVLTSQKTEEQKTEKSKSEVLQTEKKIEKPTIATPQVKNTPSSTTSDKSEEKLKEEPKKEEVFDPDKTGYIFASYYYKRLDGKTYSGKIDNEMKQVEPSDSNYGDIPITPIPVFLADGQTKFTFIIQLLNTQERWPGVKEVSITSENGEINTTVKTDEYGVARFDFSTSISGSGYITLRVDDGFAKDIKYYAQGKNLLKPYLDVYSNSDFTEIFITTLNINSQPILTAIEQLKTCPTDQAPKFTLIGPTERTGDIFNSTKQYRYVIINSSLKSYLKDSNQICVPKRYRWLIKVGNLEKTIQDANW